MKIILDKIRNDVRIQIIENNYGTRKMFLNGQEQQLDKELTDDLIMDIATAEVTVKTEKP